MKKRATRTMIRSLNAVAGTAAVTLLSATCLGGPENPQVAHGNVVISQNGNFYLIQQGSNQAIVNYSSFDIASFETVQFQQPGQFATILNRINSASPTSINGNVMANGVVFFANPAGVVFGNNAVVNTAGIYAAAADISDASFLAGNNYQFTNMAGDVIVQSGASISAMNAAHLIGRQIVNHGTVSVADGGVITMTANNGTVTISEIGGNYAVTTGGGAAFTDPGVTNTGTIDASTNGQIMLGAGDMYSLAVRLEDTGSFNIAGNDVQFTGPVELGSDITIEAETALFDGAVAGDAAGHNLSILEGDFASADATFNGAVGGTFGNAGNELGEITVRRNIVFNDTVQTTGQVTAINGNASFNDAASIGAGVTAGGFADFSDDATVTGSVFALDYVDFGDNAFVGGGVNALSGDATFGDNATVQLNVFAGDNVVFGDNGAVTIGSVQAGLGDATFGDNALVAGNVLAGQNVAFNGTTQVGGNVTALNGNAQFTGPATLGGNVTATNDVTFLADATFTGVAMDQTVSAGNELHAQGALTGIGNDGNLVLSGTNGIQLDEVVHVQQGDLTITDAFVAIGNLLANGDITLHGNGSLSGVDQDIIAGGVLQALAQLEADADGNILLSGNVVDLQDLLTHSAIGDVTIVGPGGITLAGDVSVNGGSLTIADAFTALSNLVASGDIQLNSDATFSGAGDQQVIAGALLQAMASLEKDADGNLLLQGDTVDLQSLVTHLANGDLTVSGANGITLGDTIEAQGGDLTVDNVFTALGSLLASGDITLQGDGTLAGIGSDQTIGAGGQLLAQGSLSSTELGDLILQGGTAIQLNELVEVLQGNLSITDAFTVLSDLMASGDIVLMSDGTFAGVGNDQTVDAGGSLLASGNLTSTELGNLLLEAASGIQLDGDVDVQQGGLAVVGDLTLNGESVQSSDDQLYDGAVTLSAGDKEIVSSGGDVTFTGTIDGPANLMVVAENAAFRDNIGENTALASFETVVSGDTVFDSNLIQAVNDIVLNDQVELALVPVAATIGGSGDLQIISLNGDFIMGQNQKLSVLGDLNIDASNGSATLGDISTLGDMTVTANAILVLTREPGSVLTADAALESDEGVDFVAGGLFFFNVTPTIIGDGAVQFSNPDGNGDANDTLSSFVMRAYGETFTLDMMQATDGQILDLRAQGPATTGLSDALAAAAPDESELEEVSEETQLSAGDIDLLRSMSIPVRVLDPAELSDLVEGRGVYLDGAASEVVATVPEVAINRMLTRYVDSVSDSYVSLMGTLPNSPDAPSLPETEQRIAASLSGPWAEYQRTAEGTASGFGNYLAARADEGAEAEAEALENLRNMRRLMRDYERLGLTSSEARNLPMDAIYPRITPENMTPAQLREAVQGLSQF